MPTLCSSGSAPQTTARGATVRRCSWPLPQSARCPSSSRSTGRAPLSLLSLSPSLSSLFELCASSCTTARSDSLCTPCRRLRTTRPSLDARHSPATSLRWWRCPRTPSALHRHCHRHCHCHCHCHCPARAPGTRSDRMASECERRTPHPRAPGTDTPDRCKG